MSARDIRARLKAGADAARSGDETGLAEVSEWLLSLSPRELSRVDYYAREGWYEQPCLGPASDWDNWTLAQPQTVIAVLASMHRDGYLRERAVFRLSKAADELSDRALAVRTDDYVAAVRVRAERELVRRTGFAQADRVVPVLRHLAGRWRSAGMLGRYLEALTETHGAEAVWARLRDSTDLLVRRDAFQHSIRTGSVTVADAVRLLPRERDQVVRRQLAGVIVDRASPEVVTEALLRGRFAGGRVLGLQSLTAEQLDPVVAEQLLLDRAVSVRWWARLRWREMGRDPAEFYAGVAESGARSAVRARAYVELREAGVGRSTVLALARDEDLELKKAGLTLLRGHAEASDCAWLLREMAGESARVARLAGEVLLGCPQWWSPADLAGLKASGDPELRRRAWWLHRGLWGWEAVIADLELGAYSEVRLPQYAVPDERQRTRIAELLDPAATGDRKIREIKFAAGIR